MAFRLSEKALARLESIGEYTEEKWGTTQRDKYLDALDTCFNDLARSPYKGRSRDDLIDGLRSYHEGSHVIFYLVEAEDILIIDILHQSMDVQVHSKNWL